MPCRESLESEPVADAFDEHNRTSNPRRVGPLSSLHSAIFTGRTASIPDAGQDPAAQDSVISDYPHPRQERAPMTAPAAGSNIVARKAGVA